MCVFGAFMSRVNCFVCSAEGDSEGKAVEGGRKDFGKCCGEDW